MLIYKTKSKTTVLQKIKIKSTGVPYVVDGYEFDKCHILCKYNSGLNSSLFSTKKQLYCDSMVINMANSEKQPHKKMKFNMIKLISPCHEKATGLKGMVTHAIINTDKLVKYLFQPRGINPDDGQPVQKIFVGPERLIFSEKDLETVEIPFEILGTQVTDKASGFTGMATEFVRHTHGCFHVIIQPKGTLKKTNSPIKNAEFDLRQCEGPMIEKLDAEQLAKSKKDKPSPTNMKFTSDIPRTTSGVIGMRG